MKAVVIFLLQIFMAGVISPLAFAQSPDRLALTTDLTWSSKYMIDGFKVGTSPVWQMAAKAGLYSTGISLMYWNSLQTDRRSKQYDEHDFFALYSKDFLTESSHALNLHGFYDYWFFPNTEPTRDEFGDVVSTTQKHGNKMQIGISLPKLFSLGPSFVVPTYNVYYLTYWAQDRADRFEGGFEQELSLDYTQAIKPFIPGATYQYAGATAGVNYQHGAFGVRQGFSHSVLSLTSGVYALKSIFAMSLNHQWTFEKSVNPDNEFWTTLSFVKKF